MEAKKKTKLSAPTENAALMTLARESLTGKWGIAVTTALVYIVISVLISSIPRVGFVFSFIVSGPLSLGLAVFWLNISRGKLHKIEQMFSGFNRFGTSFVAYILVVIFTLLWALLLIVPGIMAALSYSMTFFIIADDKSIDASAAIKKSKKMMYGHRWKLFCLFWRFFGWFLLCLLTLGIGFLWLFPYVSVSVAKFYEDLKANASE
jgi:uncharacterized membrane protein